jgi:hypothetical protein
MELTLSTPSEETALEKFVDVCSETSVQHKSSSFHCNDCLARDEPGLRGMAYLSSFFPRLDL